MIKRFIFTASFFFLFSTLLSAQQFSGGIKIGMARANIAGDDIGNFRYDYLEKDIVVGKEFATEYIQRVGICFGSFVRYNLNNTISIQLELYYTQKGLKAKYGAQLAMDEAGKKSISGGDWNLGYLEIPLLIKTIIPVAEPFKPNLFFGPAIGINLISKYSDVEIESIKKIDVGLIIGGGFYLSKFNFDIRYNLGLTNIADWEGDYKVKNRALTMFVGYSLF